MRRILIRAGMLPNESFDYIEMIRRNLLGDNVGNLVYQYSIVRMLMNDEGGVEFIPTRYRYHFSPQEIDVFNETCECFVIPLANAFRESFIPELKGLTELVKALKIPCYVIGVGVQASIDETKFDFSFNGDVRDFAEAVLQKSAIIGVRGQITADYLTKLGFVPEKDFTVIGCPSMYARQELSVRGADITSASDIAYNISPGADAMTIQYVRRNAGTFHSAVYIPQNLGDLKLVYAGITRKAKKEFPGELCDPSVDEAAFPGSVVAWKALLQTKSLSFGTRLHGNIMGVLSGIPTIHIPFDARTSELVSYHELVCANRKDVENGVPILELAGRMDFQKPVRVQKRNFEHYMDFLDANGISHIDPSVSEAPLDRMLRETVFPEPLRSIRQAEREEVLKRATTYSNYANQRIIDQNAKLASEEKKLEKQKADRKKIKELEQKLREKNEAIEALKAENDRLRNESLWDTWKRKTWCAR